MKYVENAEPLHTAICFVTHAGQCKMNSGKSMGGSCFHPGTIRQKNRGAKEVQAFIDKLDKMNA